MAGGKDAFMPKGIANKMKSKGLQKLKYYCQVCEKQCRDANGFKCHCLSESHIQQMRLFGASAASYMQTYSQTFLQGFLTSLRTRFGTQRVLANVVYQDYISDKEHVHMNGTRWNTLTEFIHYLKRKGLIELDETERGFYVTWIDASPLAVERRDAKERREALESNDEKKAQDQLQKQIDRALAAQKEQSSLVGPGQGSETETTPLTPVPENTAKISLKLKKPLQGHASLRAVQIPIASLKQKKPENQD